MSDYIKREDLLKQIDIDSKGNEGQYGDEWLFLKTIKSVPSADVVEVKHGRWDNMFNGKFTGGAYWYRCSNCGRIVPDVRSGGWNYCPDCGARMDGGGDDE